MNEHDFCLNNSENSSLGSGVYLTPEQNLDQTPKVVYWESNLPSAYLDTQFGDDDYIKCYTVGSADATQFKPWIMYRYYIRTANGTASKDNAFLQAQIGTRFPSSNYSTWGPFSTQSHEIYSRKLWNLQPIPGTINWSQP